MKLIEIKKQLPGTYRVLNKMFQIAGIEVFDNLNIEDRGREDSNLTRTDEQEEIFKDWLYRQLWKDKDLRNELMELPIRKKNLIDKTVNLFVMDWGLRVKD